MEGRDYFGNDGKGAQRIVFALNRSGEPVNIAVRDNVAGVTAEPTGNDDKAADRVIVKAQAGSEVILKMEPFGVSFVIYESKTQ